MNQAEKERRLELIKELHNQRRLFDNVTISKDNVQLFINLLYQSLTERVDIVAQDEDDSILQLSEYDLDKMRMFVTARREEDQQKIDEILKTKHTQVDTEVDDSGDVVFNVSVPKAKGLIGGFVSDMNVITQKDIEQLKKLEEYLKEDNIKPRFEPTQDAFLIRENIIIPVQIDYISWHLGAIFYHLWHYTGAYAHLRTRIEVSDSDAQEAPLFKTKEEAIAHIEQQNRG